MQGTLTAKFLCQVFKALQAKKRENEAFLQIGEQKACSSLPHDLAQQPFLETFFRILEILPRIIDVLRSKNIAPHRHIFRIHRPSLSDRLLVGKRVDLRVGGESVACWTMFLDDLCPQYEAVSHAWSRILSIASLCDAFKFLSPPIITIVVQFLLRHRQAVVRGSVGKPWHPVVDPGEKLKFYLLRWMKPLSIGCANNTNITGQVFILLHHLLVLLVDFQHATNPVRRCFCLNRGCVF